MPHSFFLACCRHFGKFCQREAAQSWQSMEVTIEGRASHLESGSAAPKKLDELVIRQIVFASRDINAWRKLVLVLKTKTSNAKEKEQQSLLLRAYGYHEKFVRVADYNSCSWCQGWNGRSWNELFKNMLSNKKPWTLDKNNQRNSLDFIFDSFCFIKIFFSDSISFLNLKNSDLRFHFFLILLGFFLFRFCWSFRAAWRLRTWTWITAELVCKVNKRINGIMFNWSAIRTQWNLLKRPLVLPPAECCILHT